MSDEMKKLIVTPKQYKEGYFEMMDGGVVHAKEYTLYGRTKDGNYIVIDPHDEIQKKHRYNEQVLKNWLG